MSPLSVYRIIFIGQLRVRWNRFIIKDAHRGRIYPEGLAIKEIYCQRV